MTLVISFYHFWNVYVPNVKADHSQSIGNPKCSSRNAGDRQGHQKLMLCEITVASYLSFIKQDLLKRLVLHGLNLKTLTGGTSEESLMVNKLKATSVNKTYDWISIPKTYSKKTIPVGKEEVIIPENLSRWKCLVFTPSSRNV